MDQGKDIILKYSISSNFRPMLIGPSDRDVVGQHFFSSDSVLKKIEDELVGVEKVV